MITPLQFVRKSAGTLLGIGGVSCALTLLYLASRVVMSMGGSCGSGGPYVVAAPCPDGFGLILPLSIFGGLVSMGVYTFSLLPVGPRLVILAWPALFLSLGSAFLEAGLSDPHGIDWSFFGCGVLFVLMGATPLLFLLGKGALRTIFWGPAPKEPVTGARGTVRWTTSVVLPGQNARGGPPRDAPAVAEYPQDAVPARDAPGDLVGQLERLSALHRSGRLDDDEYAAAKARLLNGSG
ncbi:SHOCT domain-containing protein [Sphaerisporangium fuscum]|uniref:SHOCT domain-containing protein n=1 Tax=Sphaerisporangium fuscum TaxID=2835868 RepID=UPI001BDC8733|nr:SHOCT domain-containing protein [Sphaerisporangium fuscum]